MHLNKFKFSKEGFENIVRASSNSNWVEFSICQIDLSSDIDFSGPEYKTSYLSLWWIGNQAENDWKNHPDRLKRVLKAISMCSLKDSLKTMNIRNSGFDIKTVEDMLTEFKLGNIKITKDVDYALDE